MHIEKEIPLIPLKGEVLFPGVEKELTFGRPRSVTALLLANDSDRLVFFTSQVNNADNTQATEFFSLGVVARLSSEPEKKDGNYKVSIEVLYRAQIKEVVDEAGCFWAKLTNRPEFFEDDLDSKDNEVARILGELESNIDRIKELRRDFSASSNLDLWIKMRDLRDFVAYASTYLSVLDFRQKQSLLEEDSIFERLLKLSQMIASAAENTRNPASPKRQLIQEKLEALRRERDSRNATAENNVVDNENEELERTIKALNISDTLKQRLLKELQKLQAMAPMSAEATVIRNYIDWLLALPWNIFTKDNHDILAAEKILAHDHHGLEKPKERILEFLAVQSLVNKLKGPILCFVGPPGVGKTSLASSVARAMGRKFVRVSLGGVRDEAEIRGHRRTYIGAMPGKIIQYIRRAGSSNPVFLLDEIDKLSNDYRGDPSSALLEVLDPEQNSRFNDHYLDTDFDLSSVVFIATANSLDGIPIPLRDRMEIIEIESYTEEEKLKIAKTYLVPKQLTNNGIDVFDVKFTPAALRLIINEYTLEAGVRSLDREISSICRKVACELLKNPKQEKVRIGPDKVRSYLGKPKIRARKIEANDEIGITTGLAVTMFGGTTLKSEVSVVPGTGKLIITGQLKDVMMESAQAAMSYVRSRAMSFGLEPDFSKNVDIHIHFPGDHAPKDGPSAGITMACSMISALTHTAVRRDIAMTGEITLRGRVLAIGGVRDKLLAAKRYGIKTVLIPKENWQDYEEIAPSLLKGLEVIPVSDMDEVVLSALKLNTNSKRKLIQSFDSTVELPF